MKSFITVGSVLASEPATQKFIKPSVQIDAVQLTQLQSGLCQTMAGYDLFDIKKFDNENPVVYSIDAGTVFFKACDTDAFSMSEDILDLDDQTSGVDAVPSSCSGPSHAFIVNGDGECAYTFTKPVDFNGTPKDASDDLTEYIGFTLDWTSDETCSIEKGEGEVEVGNFNLKVQADCAEGEESWALASQDQCSATLQYTGPSGCKQFSFKYLQYAEALRPYIGAMMIAGGLLMVFAGAKLVIGIFSCAVFFSVFWILFSLFYNKILPHSVPGYVLIAVAVASAVAAGYLAYFSKAFARKFAVALIAGWGGIILALIMSEILGIKNATMTILLSLGLGCFGFELGQYMNSMVKCTVTAFVGAGLTMKGVSFYVLDLAAYSSGDVSTETLEADQTLWILITSLFVLFITGTFVQLRFSDDHNPDKDDDFSTQDQ